MQDHRHARSRAASCSAAPPARPRRLPMLHELVPHQARPRPARAAPARPGTATHGGDHGAHKGSGHRGAVGSVDPRSTASTRTRSCATSTRARVARRRAASGRSSPRTRRSRSRRASSTPAWTYNGRVPGPDAAGAARASGCGSTSSTRSDHPHTMHFHGIHRDVHGRRARDRRRQHRAGPAHDLRVRRRAVRPPPLPLPLDPAGRPHRQGPLRRCSSSIRSRGGRRPTSS